MTVITRRSALVMGFYITGATTLLAQSNQENVRQDDPLVDSSNDGSGAARPPISYETIAHYWNRALRDLNAFDHSFLARRRMPNEQEDAVDNELRRQEEMEEGRQQILMLVRAPGPVASARALGLAHAVLADAMFAVAPEKRYALWKTDVEDVEAKSPPMFVGGAVSTVVRHIYSSKEHLHLLAPYESEFIRRYSESFSDDDNKTSWQQGVNFVVDNGYLNYWDPAEIMDRINTHLPDSDPDRYQPQDNQHNVDPENPGQGFYGQKWGTSPQALVLSSEEIMGACPKPPNGHEVPREQIEEVAKLGWLGLEVPEDVRDIPELLDPPLTDEQRELGLFWAYDGARMLGTPPRFFNQIVAEATAADQLDDLDAARAFALCNLALSDAGNAAWYAKYEYAIWRPILGVRKASNPEPGWDKWYPLGAPRTNRPDFDPLPPGFLEREQFISVQDVFLGGSGVVVPELGFAETDEVNREFRKVYSLAAFTPNFPAYPSGHATFGAACIETLDAVLKDSVSNSSTIDSDRHIKYIISDELNGHSNDNFQSRPREFVSKKSLTGSEIINENNLSRIHLGVHWLFDSTSGEAAGRSVSEIVLDRVYKPRVTAQ